MSPMPVIHREQTLASVVLDDGVMGILERYKMMMMTKMMKMTPTSWLTLHPCIELLP